MRLYRETECFPEPVWMFWDEPYLYTGDTLWFLLWSVVTGWRDDRHLVG